jgi:hypothetical protein
MSTIAVLLDRMSNLRRQERPDVADEEAQDEARPAESNRDPVWPPVRQRKRLLRRCKNDRESVPLQYLRILGENLLNLFELRSAHEFRDVGDDGQARRSQRVDDSKRHGWNGVPSAKIHILHGYPWSNWIRVV